MVDASARGRVLRVLEVELPAAPDNLEFMFRRRFTRRLRAPAVFGISRLISDLDRARWAQPPLEGQPWAQILVYFY